MTSLTGRKGIQVTSRWKLSRLRLTRCDLVSAAKFARSNEWVIGRQRGAFAGKGTFSAAGGL
jgi:hypothetical protein